MIIYSFVLCTSVLWTLKLQQDGFISQHPVIDGKNSFFYLHFCVIVSSNNPYLFISTSIDITIDKFSNLGGLFI